MTSGFPHQPPIHHDRKLSADMEPTPMQGTMNEELHLSSEGQKLPGASIELES